jgi:hypothetical protein
MDTVKANEKQINSMNVTIWKTEKREIHTEVKKDVITLIHIIYTTTTTITTTTTTTTTLMIKINTIYLLFPPLLSYPIILIPTTLNDNNMNLPYFIMLRKLNIT